MTFADIAVLAAVTVVPFAVRHFSRKSRRKRNCASKCAQSGKCGCSCSGCGSCAGCSGEKYARVIRADVSREEKIAR